MTLYCTICVIRNFLARGLINSANDKEKRLILIIITNEKRKFIVDVIIKQSDFNITLERLSEFYY